MAASRNYARVRIPASSLLAPPGSPSALRRPSFLPSLPRYNWGLSPRPDAARASAAIRASFEPMQARRCRLWPPATCAAPLGRPRTRPPRTSPLPTQWGRWGVETLNNSLPRGATALLGFNEPNHAEQAALSPGDAAALWPLLEAAAGGAGGLRLGSPSAAPCGANCFWSPDPFAWLSEFFKLCRGCRIDFVTTHYCESGARASTPFSASTLGENCSLLRACHTALLRPPNRCLQPRLAASIRPPDAGGVWAARLADGAGLPRPRRPSLLCEGAAVHGEFRLCLLPCTAASPVDQSF